MIEVRRACSRSGRRVSSVIGPSSRRQYGALEEDEAARVEAGQVVEALLREQENGVQPLARRAPCALHTIRLSNSARSKCSAMVASLPAGDGEPIDLPEPCANIATTVMP